MYAVNQHLDAYCAESGSLIMKAVKLFLAAALALLLVSMPLPRAAADAIYPAPGTVEAGTYLDHLVATVSAAPWSFIR